MDKNIKDRALRLFDEYCAFRSWAERVADRYAVLWQGVNEDIIRYASLYLANDHYLYFRGLSDHNSFSGEDREYNFSIPLDYLYTDWQPKVRKEVEAAKKFKEELKNVKEESAKRRYLALATEYGWGKPIPSYVLCLSIRGDGECPFREVVHWHCGLCTELFYNFDDHGCNTPDTIDTQEKQGQ